MSRLDGVPLRRDEVVLAGAHEVHVGTFGNECGEGEQMRGNSICRVQRDRKPDSLAISFRNAVTPQKITCGVRAIHLIAQMAFPITGRQAEIMEHSRYVEKFRVKSQTPTVSCRAAQ